MNSGLTFVVVLALLCVASAVEKVDVDTEKTVEVLHCQKAKKDTVKNNGCRKEGASAANTYCRPYHGARIIATPSKKTCTSTWQACCNECGNIGCTRFNHQESTGACELLFVGPGCPADYGAHGWMYGIRY